MTRLLSEEQLADYQPFFDNHRRLKALVHEIEELSLALVEYPTPAGPAPLRPRQPVHDPWSRRLNLRDGVFLERGRAVQANCEDLTSWKRVRAGQGP